MLSYRKNIFSQFGEDGIIEQIFKMLPHQDLRFCIEFGAWDGLVFSNTANLWKNNNWKALLVECDNDKFVELKTNTINYNIICINKKVNINNDSIDSILESNGITEEVDLLSIDVDGNDYYIFEKLIIKPKVIIVEYNPTIPYWIDCYQYPDKYAGCSIKSLIRVANEKGYFLSCATDTNAIFIDEKYKSIFKDFCIEQITKKHYNFIITDYSGKYLEIGSFPYGKGVDLNKDVFIINGKI